MSYNTVLFDLDGTLLNSIEDLCDSTNFALEHFGFPVRSLEEVTSFVGNGVHKLIERAVPEHTQESIVLGVLKCFKQYYSNHLRDKTKPYDEIPELLLELNRRNIKTAIISNKFDLAVNQLKDFYFQGQIQIAIGESNTIPKKPDPKGVFEAMRQLGVTAKECIYVGDSEVDIETAKNAGVTSIGVTWGFRSRECLINAGANIIIDHPLDVLKLFE